MTKLPPRAPLVARGLAARRGDLARRGARQRQRDGGAGGAATAAAATSTARRHVAVGGARVARARRPAWQASTSGRDSSGELANAEAEIERARRKLADARFVERAPAHLVEAEREKARALRARGGRAARPPRRPRRVTAHGYLESLAAFGMKLGLERITALLERARAAAGAARRDPRRRHERQVLDRALRRRRADRLGPAHRRLPLAARDRLGRARADRRAPDRRGRARARARSRRRTRRARSSASTARARRSSRRSPRPRSSCSPRRASRPASSRPASAAVTTRRA